MQYSKVIFSGHTRVKCDVNFGGRVWSSFLKFSICHQSPRVF